MDGVSYLFVFSFEIGIRNGEIILFTVDMIEI
jgi:hypothetical protein